MGEISLRVGLVQMVRTIGRKPSNYFISPLRFKSKEKYQIPDTGLILNMYLPPVGKRLFHVGNGNNMT